MVDKSALIAKYRRLMQFRAGAKSNPTCIDDLESIIRFAVEGPRAGTVSLLKCVLQTLRGTC